MAIPEIFADSMVMGRATFEGVTSIREWFVRLYELEAGDHGSFGKRTEIGHARLFTIPELSQDSLHESDIITGDLETVLTALVENEDPQLWAPVLILDELYVKPQYRGRGLAEEVAKAAFAWFEGLVNSEALAVTTRPKFRPAATRIVGKLGFRHLKDDVWVREGRPRCSGQVGMSPPTFRE